MEMTFEWLVKKEYDRVCSKNKEINSSHEGYALILEELDELWEEVKLKPAKRDSLNMLKELVQIAVTAQRMAECLNLVKIARYSESDRIDWSTGKIIEI